MTRRHRPLRCGTIALALIGSALLVAVAGLGGALAAESGSIPAAASLDAAMWEMLMAAGLAAPTATPVPPPTHTPPPPSLTPFLPSSITSTPTPSTTPTPTATASPTATPTSTATLTPTATASASSTASPAWIASATRTPPRAPTKTKTPRPATTATAGTSPGSTPEASPSEPTPESPPSATTPAPPQCSASADSGIEAQVVDLINTERSERGLEEYDVDRRLREAARVQALDMACNHFTSHTGSDGSTVRDRLERQGYSWSWIGENYYVTRNTATGARTAFDWWMNSTPHRNNLLSPNYTEFGVGYVYDPESDHGGYFVAVFARPR